MAIPTKLNKTNALAKWESLPDGDPIKMSPIDTGQTGSTYTEDTMRLTGSQEFIDSMLSNLKGMLEYENDTSSRLEIIYTQTCEREFKVEDGKRKVIQGELTGSYAFYVKCKSRGHGRKGRKPSSKNSTPREPKSEKAVNPLRKVNAGLGLRGRPRKTEIAPPAPEATPAKKGTSKPAYTDTIYALAKAYTDEETGKREYEFLEPIGDHPIFKMQTYTDYSEFDSALERLAKKHKIKEKDIQKIEVKVGDDGTLTFEEW